GSGVAPGAGAAKSGQKPDHKATAGKQSSLAAAATAAAWKGAKSPEEAEAELRRQAEIIKNIKIQSDKSGPDRELAGQGESDSTRPFTVQDFRLLASLWPLTKPFRGVMFWGVFMIVASAVVSLALPYLTKVAIDRYILPLGRLFHLESPEALAPGALPNELIGRLKPEMLIKAGDGLYVLPAGKADLIDRRQERALVASGRLEPEKFYFRPVLPVSTGADSDPAGLDTEGLDTASMDLESAKRVLAHSPHGRMAGSLLAIPEKDLVGLKGGLALTLRGADVEKLGRLALAFAILMVFGYVFDVGQRYYLEAASQRLGHSLRETLLAHLFSLSQSFFDRQQTARLTSRLTSDINNINAMVKSTAASFFSDLLGLFGVVAIMFALSPRLAIAALVLTPLVGLLSYHFSRISRDIQRDLRGKVAAINQAFSETMAGMAVIKAFRREKQSSREFEILNEDNYQTGFRQVHSVAIFLPLVDMCASVVLALILYVGGLGVIGDYVSLGVLAAFVGYSNRFFNPIKDLAEKVNTFQSAFASLERLIALMKVDEVTPSGGLSPAKDGGRVDFENVSFRYSPDGPLVLSEVNVTVEKGQSVALVGSTGSGKSSLISLMLRFYDPTEGRILFDGADLRDLDLKAHRKRVGLVTQDVYLYSASVMDNLRLGRADLSDGAVIQAAKAVGAHDFIERLPRGYGEELGPAGLGFSAGQKQLIACARALIDSPEIVILDEATAFVDSETELLIEKAMNTLFKGRTSLVIAHRLSTIRRVDMILVLHYGKIVERGTHAELLAKKGFYHHLAKLQGLA
ncbi:MAG: ABC transporter ATP-binding protein/permease, partial [Deltaproteobacteria bacterium]|nr:ABC transporter ATP-binding protein/permease [Deltaproteobacteria bacterium]